MIRITFTVPDTPEWQQWRRDVSDAITEMMKVGTHARNETIKPALYKRTRQEFYAAFHGKCAYCERRITLDQPGDIDHFRPKAAVIDENDKPVAIDPGDGPKPHPGYYWLAYEWENLLPACSLCNRPHKLKSGQLVGKSTRFPVTGKHEWQPGEERKESPYFIHPVFEDPQDDLTLQTETGIITSSTTRGQYCIKVLDLNREGLPEARRARYRELRKTCRSIIQNLLSEKEDADELAEDMKLVNQCISGEAELAWAGRLAILTMAPKLQSVAAVFQTATA